MENRILIGEGTVNLLVKNVELGYFTSEQVLRLSVELGVNGECLSNIKDILKRFCNKQELHNSPGQFKISSEEAVQKLVCALKHPSIQQTNLANQIAPDPSLVHATTETPQNKMESTIMIEEIREGKDCIPKKAPVPGITGCSPPAISLAHAATSETSQNETESSVIIEDITETNTFIPRKDSVLVITADSPTFSFSSRFPCLPLISNDCLTKALCAWGILSIFIIAILLLVTFVPVQEKNTHQQERMNASIATTVATAHDVSSLVGLDPVTLGMVPNTTIAMQNDQGAILFGKTGTVQWIKSCPTNKYTTLLSDLDIKIEYFGFTQVDDDIWVCGGKDGKHEQSKTCRVLSMLDGQWKIFEHQMNHPRIKSLMFVEGRRVIVMGGITSDPNSKTGCRATQEVFDRDNPEQGWTIEIIVESNVCAGISQNIKVNCR